MSTPGEVRFGRYRLAGPLGPLRTARGDTVPLPRKALALLWTLVCRAGEVVTKDELLATVWPGLVVTDGVISACLRDLRRALHDDPKHPSYVATVHRIGYRFVAQVSSHPPAPRHEPQASAQVPSSRLVGRDDALARLHTAFAAASGGRRRLVFVTGEAGIGKSALVETFVSRLVQACRAESGTPDATGLRVAYGQCIEHYGAGEAYLPVLEAVTRLCRQPDGAVLMALLHRFAPTWLAQLPGLLDDSEHVALQRRTAGSGVERILRELVEAIEAAAEARPLLLVFEDMQWSDYSTLDWLAMLAQRREAARLLVVVTCRPTDAAADDHPLKRVRHELVTRGAAMEVALGYLSPDAVQTYVEQRLPGQREELASAVYRHSQGHPLFMVHVTDDLQQGTAHCCLPRGVGELIEAQLARLAPDQQAVLEAASVAGAEFAAASVAAALRSATEQIDQVLEALAQREQFIETRGLAEWYDGTVSGRYAFRHDLYREALYRRLGDVRRMHLHAHIGERLAQAYGQRSGEIAAELALHFEHARERVRAARFSREAGEKALYRYAYREALAHVDKGLALLGSQPAGDDGERTELLLRLTQGAALLATEGFGAPQVEATYARALSLSARLNDTGALGPALSGLCNMFLTRAAFAKARETADEVFGLVQRQPQPDPVLSMLSHNLQGTVLLFVGEPAAALAHVDPSLALYDPPRHRLLSAEYGEDPGVACHHYATLTRWVLGYPDAADRHVAQGLELARSLSHAFGEAQMLWAQAVVGLDGGRLAGLDDVTERLIALCMANDFPLWLAGGRILRGGVLGRRGAFDEGLALIDQGLRAWRAAGTLLTLPHALALAATVHATNGHAGAALQRLDEAIETVRRTGERWYEAELYRLRGEFILQLPDAAADVARSRAEACFRHAIDMARQQQVKLLELRASSSLARLWRLEGKSAAAVSMLTTIHGWFTEGFETPDLKQVEALLDTMARRG